MSFRALLLNKTDDGVTHKITELSASELPEHAVTIATEFTTMNYKDGMAITGRPGIVRNWPMVPGVDVVGTVESGATDNDPFSDGDRVTINGFDVGEAHWGGFSQKAKVAADWITPLPDGITNQQAAAIGTAGYTAMLCVMALEDQGITNESGPVVVTGAAGGVGSVATALLAKLGFEVIASTGRAEQEGDYLRGLGASDVIARDELGEPSSRPLGKPRWAAGIDAVGSHTLANVLAATQPDGVVACCGLAQGPDLPASVLPFILRGITLQGINCVQQSQARRTEAWNRLAADLDMAKLDEMTTVRPLGDSAAVAEEIMAGQTRGRVVIDVNA